MDYSNNGTILIIDTSGSMSEPASTDIECIGFTRMDFACQGANLCINACPESMYMGIIIFDSISRELCSLSQMNQSTKDNMLEKINNIHPCGGTNIISSMRILKSMINKAKINNVTNINVITLTDGEDSILKEHNVESLFNEFKTDGEFNFNMDTIGFGPNACTSLLIKIANMCSGSYALCYDASMVGTIFGRTFVRTYINENAYGIYEDNTEKTSEYFLLKERYHYFRTKLSEILLTKNIKKIESFKSEIFLFFSKSPPFEVMNPNWYQLISDLEYDLNEQISLAISKPEYWKKWGEAYWQTLGIALDKQYSANFKDISLQCFGNDIAKQEYDRVCDIYDNMPMIKPSGSIEKRTTVIPQYSSAFNNASSGCFHPNSTVVLASGERITLIQLEQILLNDNNIRILKNNNEYVKIEKLIKIPQYQLAQFCQINRVILTPTHPILYNGRWEHPKNISPVFFSSVQHVYNIILQKNQDGFRETSLLVDNETCIALCHGIPNDEIATDSFWGSETFIDKLKNLYPEYDNVNIITIRHQFIRNSETGYIDSLI